VCRKPKLLYMRHTRNRDGRDRDSVTRPTSSPIFPPRARGESDVFGRAPMRNLISEVPGQEFSRFTLNLPSYLRYQCTRLSRAITHVNLPWSRYESGRCATDSGEKTADTAAGSVSTRLGKPATSLTCLSLSQGLYSLWEYKFSGYSGLTMISKFKSTYKP
jgi:hypothetical protein